MAARRTVFGSGSALSRRMIAAGTTALVCSAACGGTPFTSKQDEAGAPSNGGFSAGAAGSADASGSGGDGGSGGAVSSGGALGLDASAGGASLGDAGLGTGGTRTEAGVADASDHDAVSTDAGTCSRRIATAETGIFVDASASDESEQTGTPERPVSTLARALELAFDQGLQQIYLAPGQYAGVTITGFSTALTLSGGWQPDATAWTLDCDPRAHTRSSILAPGEFTPALRVENNAATVQLETLTVKSSEPIGSSGGIAGSSIAIRVRGETSGPTLRLSDVIVEAGRGGDGATAGQRPANGNRVCGGVNDCATSAEPGDVGRAGIAAEAGTFSSEGFAPQTAEQGQPGQQGDNGTPGEDGERCQGCLDYCYGSFPQCQKATIEQLGQAGRCGCGGLGGQPGRAGRSGGASVGLLVADKSTVVAGPDVTIRSGRGGDGSAGGPGGMGGPGTPGTAGDESTCALASETACVQFGSGTQCVQGATLTTCTATGGSAGGHGQPGGTGGRGGHGHGGPSYAVVLVTGGELSASGAQLLFGNSGLNGDGTLPPDNAGELFRP